MPNWCANRLRVTGPESEVSKVRTLMEGSADVPGYLRAAGEGIQLFLAGCVGLVQTVTPTEYAPYPALTNALGRNTPENRAFSEWVVQLREGAELTPETCGLLHALWLASGLRSMTWEVLTAEQQAVITALWEKKRGDWQTTLYGQNLSEVWNRLCREEQPPCSTLPFDMLQLLRRVSMRKSTVITVVCLRGSRTALRTPSTAVERSGHTRTTLTCRTSQTRPLTLTSIRPGRRPRRKCCVH